MPSPEQTDPTRAALDAGIKDVVREMTEATIAGTTSLRAKFGDKPLIAYREGLQELRGRVREYEDRILELHLRLGMRDAQKISSRIVDELGRGVERLNANAHRACAGSPRGCAASPPQWPTAEVARRSRSIQALLAWASPSRT